MGWDIWVFDFPKTAAKPTDIPHGWVPPKIGRRSDLLERIKEVAPEVTYSVSDDGTAGDRGGIEGGLEIRIPGEGDEEINCFVMAIHGDESNVALAIRILEGLGFRGADTATGGFLERGSPAGERVRNWLERRANIVGDKPKRSNRET